ncbi:hypothetical protein KSP40_PGU000849 [Platanthera guangdongensis]|uniref:Uncharacterized protein n=1 Tax=Platanthera guangdongensis TaxID=2320717 RepID=A0ABR2N0E3_9ASPA
MLLPPSTICFSSRLQSLPLPITATRSFSPAPRLTLSSFTTLIPAPGPTFPSSSPSSPSPIHIRSPSFTMIFSISSAASPSPSWDSICVPGSGRWKREEAFPHRWRGQGRDMEELEGVGDCDREEGRRWEEVGRFPEMMCQKFVSICNHDYSQVYCMWQEGVVCICCTARPGVLLFKVGRGIWHWLPKCPLIKDKWSCESRWFSFALDLYAMV